VEVAKQRKKKGGDHRKGDRRNPPKKKRILNLRARGKKLLDAGGNHLAGVKTKFRNEGFTQSRGIYPKDRGEKIKPGDLGGPSNRTGRCRRKDRSKKVANGEGCNNKRNVNISMV